MTTSKSYSIKLINKSYDIKCPDSEAENLQLAAEKLNKQLLQNKKEFKQLDEFHNMLLAAIHLSHELILTLKQQEHQRRQVAQFINSLENKIDQVVRGDLEKNEHS